MLVSSKSLVEKAQQEGYAVGAFNIENMEMAMAAIEAAEEMRSPIIVQTTPKTVQYANVQIFHGMVQAICENTSVPVALHLDHGDSVDMAMAAYRAGYTSIMIDGSKLPFEENCKVSKLVADVCHAGNVCVEAELGKVGGKEDGHVENNPAYTEPQEAVTFVKETGVDMLAVAIGTAHGVYKGIPKLDVERLSEIKAVVSIPLVLHGTSGVPEDIVQECVRRGICKVNYATDLRIEFSKGVKEVLDAKPDTIDPKAYNKVGKEYVKEYVKGKIKLLGSENKGC